MDIFADQGKVRAIYHVSVGVSDIERARRFYGTILSPLGYKLPCTSPTSGQTYPLVAQRRTREVASTLRFTRQMPTP